MAPKLPPNLSLIATLIGVLLGLTVLGACAATRPQATAGLLGEGAPFETLAKKGDLGFEALRFPVRQVRLGSGLRIAIEKAPTRAMVAAILTVGAGASNDPAGKEGLAHLVEHLAFRTKLAERGPEVDFALLRLGDGIRNAKTDTDLTTYESAIPKKNLADWLNVMAALLADPLAGISDEEAATEREIVQNEYLLRDESGTIGQVRGWIHQALFPAGHPYARAIGGTVQSVAGLSLNEARDFARQHYRPDNTTITLIGDLEPAEIDRLLEALPATFAGAGPAQEPARMPFVPLTATPPRAERTPAYQTSVDRPGIVVSWRLPNVYGQNGALVKIITSPAGHSIMARWLRLENGVRDVSIWAWEYRQATVLTCWIDLDDAKNRDVIAAIAAKKFIDVWRPMSEAQAAEIAQARVQPTVPRLEQYQVGLAQPRHSTERGRILEVLVEDEAIMAQMRQQTTAAVVFGAESFSARAAGRAHYLHLMGDSGTFVKTLAQVVNAGYEDVAAFATRELDPARARVVYLDPLPRENRKTAALIGIANRDISKVGDRPFQATDFGAAPQAAAPPELATAKVFHLENGLEVALIPRRNYPVVTVALGYNSGVSASKPPAAAVFLRFLEKRFDVNDRFNALAVESFDRADLSYEVVRAGKRNLANALYMLAYRLKLFDLVSWDDVIDNIKLTDGKVLAENITGKPSVYAESTAALYRSLFGNHPYGRTAVGAQELLDLSGDDMAGWILQSRSPPNVVITIAGDIDPAATEILVRRWFGGWKQPRGTFEQMVTRMPKPQPGPARETLFVHHEADTKQTSVVMACRLPNGGEREAAGYDVLAGVVGGYLSTRIREEGGAAYSVGAKASVWRGGTSALSITVSVDNQRLADVLRILRGHWRAFGEGTFDSGALSQVKWQYAARANLAFQTSSELAVSALDALNHGWSVKHPARHHEYVTSTNAEDLARAFAVCRATTVLSLVGDKNALGNLGLVSSP